MNPLCSSRTMCTHLSPVGIFPTYLSLNWARSFGFCSLLGSTEITRNIFTPVMDKKVLHEFSNRGKSSDIIFYDN